MQKPPDGAVFVRYWLAFMQAGVVFDLVGVALDGLPGVFFQVEALAALEGEVGLVGRIEFGRQGEGFLC